MHEFDKQVTILTKRIVVVRHDICEGVGYVSTCYDLLGFPCLVSKLYGI